MLRRRYLISYDIADDKRRDEVFKSLKDEGDHAQYSVFFCELDHRELASLRGRLAEAIHAREDQVMILDLGESDNPVESRLETLGKAYEPPARAMVV